MLNVWILIAINLELTLVQPIHISLQKLNSATHNRCIIISKRGILKLINFIGGLIIVYCGGRIAINWIIDTCTYTTFKTLKKWGGDQFTFLLFHIHKWVVIVSTFVIVRNWRRVFTKYFKMWYNFQRNTQSLCRAFRYCGSVTWLSIRVKDRLFTLKNEFL